MEVTDAATNFVVANTTNSQAPRFTVTGLRPGTSYIVSISASNGKGRSDLTKIDAFTAKQPERMTESGESALTKESILPNSIPAVNFPGQFFILKFWTNFH
jgi:hypothetical protein